MQSIFSSLENRKNLFHVNGKIYLLEILFVYELIKQYQLIFFYFLRHLLKIHVFWIQLLLMEKQILNKKVYHLVFWTLISQKKQVLNYNVIHQMMIFIVFVVEFSYQQERMFIHVIIIIFFYVDVYWELQIMLMDSSSMLVSFSLIISILFSLSDIYKVIKQKLSNHLVVRPVNMHLLKNILIVMYFSQVQF